MRHAISTLQTKSILPQMNTDNNGPAPLPEEFLSYIEAGKFLFNTTPVELDCRNADSRGDHAAEVVRTSTVCF
jgi:hypothetical protein